METTQVIRLLRNGKIGVIPTDTIYGIVGSALNPQTVEEIYRLRKRDKSKPMIILISSIQDLEKFEIKLTQQQKNFLEKNWPNPVSVVLPCTGGKWKYLHRGTESLAFRMPKDQDLLKILEKVGPLVAPSANFEREKSSKTINEAKEYFGNQVAFYIDGGNLESQPSTIVRLDNDGTLTILRQGPYKIFT